VKLEQSKALLRVVENVISLVEITKIESREWQHGMFLASRLEFENMICHCCNHWTGAKKFISILILVKESIGEWEYPTDRKGVCFIILVSRSP
jgi:hypothetical protein